MPVFFLLLEKKKKKEDLQFSKQCRLCFCVKVFFWFFFHICDTPQSVWVSHRREGMWRRGRDSLWPAYYKRRMWVEGCFLLHLELIFSWEPQLMSGSSELLASIGGIWRGETGRSCWRFFCRSVEFTQGYLEFKDVYLILKLCKACAHSLCLHTYISRVRPPGMITHQTLTVLFWTFFPPLCLDGFTF